MQISKISRATTQERRETELTIATQSKQFTPNLEASTCDTLLYNDSVVGYKLPNMDIHGPFRATSRHLYKKWLEQLATSVSNLYVKLKLPRARHSLHLRQFSRIPNTQS